VVKSKNDLLPGTLDVLILKTLSGGAEHGYGIARKIQETSREVLEVEEGSLYPALHRMERKGWIEPEWGQSESNRRAKFYSLTRSGKKHLKHEAESWKSFSGAVTRVLEARPVGG
jgi:PadR family transcriptional regulator PadR